MPLSDRQPAARKGVGGPKIALVVDLYDWHARDLTAAFARAGAIAVPVRLSQCGFDTRRPSGLVIPGFGADLPDAVFVRAIGSGTFESVTLRPHATLAPGSDEATARRLHEDAARMCFIARSVSFRVEHEPTFS